MPKVWANLPPILLLLAGERIEAEFEIARHQLLHAVAVEADQLAQEADRQQVRAPALLLDDDLGQDRMGQVFAGLGVVDDEVALAPDHFGQVLERHIGACIGIVEPAVRVFLDDDRPALLFRVPCHVAIAPTPWASGPRLLYAATAKSVARSLCSSTRGFAASLNAAPTVGFHRQESLRYDLGSPVGSGDGV